MVAVADSASPFRIHRGESSDVPAVLNLLQSAGLPTSDLASAQRLHLWVCRAGSLQGAIALEHFGNEALLRSLAVAAKFRRQGLGRALVERLEHDARTDGIERLILLTETAEPFFRSLGYVKIERQSVSETRRQSAEFRSLRPASAVCMSKALRVYDVLFLCTGNSARSILAESILNRHGNGRFRAFSAGSHPNGQLNPYALDLLKRLDFPTGGLRSKSWDEFTTPEGPRFDFIITVCDNAASETCPVWPGTPTTGHWSIPDPAATQGTDIEKKAAVNQAFQNLDTRIRLFLRYASPSQTSPSE
jgi:protein-tyrosine-phosphatase/N-acetylglutamate synthase-like GNAT family acetyltransferase